MCHRYDFLVCLIGMDLHFLNFLLFFYSGIDHDPPCSLCSHDLCLFLFPYVIFHSSHDHVAKRSHNRIMIFLTSEFLFYGRLLTLILFHFLHNTTTPILPVYIDKRRPHLKKDTTRPQGVVQRKIPRVLRRTFFAPD